MALDASGASTGSADSLATAKTSASEAPAAGSKQQQPPLQQQQQGGWFSSWWGGGGGGGGQGAKAGGGKGKGAAGGGKGADPDGSDSDSDAEEWQDVVRLGDGEEEEVEEGDVSLDDLITQAGASLAASGPAAPQASAAALFRVCLRTRTVLSVYAARRAPLLELSSALALEAAQTGDTLSASLRLPEFNLKDLYTPTALFSHIAKAGEHAVGTAATGGESSSSSDIFFLALETSPRATSVRIRTRPLDLAYNKGWLARVLALRPPPEVTEALAQRAVQNLNAATAVAASALAQSTLRADIEIAAPRIFVPLAESEDRGFLLLDTGHLSFKGGTFGDDPGASQWDLRLSRIQSQLLLRKADWLLGRLAAGEGQLIEPFEIHVGLRMRGEGKPSGGGSSGSPGRADMSVTTTLFPGIRGIFTPQRLKTTLAIVTDLGLPPLPEDEAGAGAGGGGVAAAAEEGALRSPAIGESALQLHRQVAADNGAAAALAPPSRRGTMDASEAASSSAARPSSSSVGDREADPLHVKMEVRVEIPTVALELRADAEQQLQLEQLQAGASGRLFLVAMDGFHMDYAARSYDSTIDLVLGALSIENLAGQAPQPLPQQGGQLPPRRFLAQSSSGADAGGGQHASASSSSSSPQSPGLVHFRMVAYEDRLRAPGYDGHDRVILLEFAALALKCDPDSLRLLAPFYGALMRFEEEKATIPTIALPAFPPGPGLKRTMSMASNASTTLTQAAAELSARAAAAAALAAAQEGGKTMAVTARLARVSMELLTGGAGRRPVIMAEIAGLGAEVEMGEAMDVRVVLRTFEVTDTQPESRDNAIRKLICPKQGLAEEEEAALATTITLPPSLGAKAGAGTAVVAEAEEGEGAGAVAAGRKPLLVAHVKEDKGDRAYDIDLTLEDFTLNVLVEAIMATVDVTLENVNAVLAVLAAGQPPQQSQQQQLLPPPLPVSPSLPPASSSDVGARLAGLSLGGKSPSRMGRIGEGDEARSDEEEAMPGDHTRLSASQLQGVKEGGGEEEEAPLGLRVKIKLLNPGLILIENARNYDSRAVSMRGTFHVLYVSKADGTAGTESLHVDAQGLEAFVDVVGGSEAGPVQIITPFALGAHQKKQSERGKLLVSELLLNLDRVLTRVAYHDVMLVQGILAGLGDASARFQATTAAAAAATAAAAAAASQQQGQGQALVPGWAPEASGEELRAAGSSGRVGEEEGDNDSEVELPLSAADEELMRTKSTALSKLSVSLAGVEVLFINDYEGLEQPLVEVGLEDAHFAMEQCADAYQGDGGLRLRARFFNPTVLFWEPVVEPWEVRCDVSTEASGVVVSVATERVLYLDLTEAFLQTLSRTYSLFLSATDASAPAAVSTTESGGSLSANSSLRSLPSAGSGPGSSSSMTASPYLFTNRTGLELTVDGGGGPVLVAPNATVALEVVKEGRPVRGASDATATAAAAAITRREVAGGGAAGAGGSVTVAFTGAVGEQRRPLSKLRTDVPGTFVYTLKPAQEQGRVYPAPVVEETWENERSDRVTPTWRSPFLPTDRPRWSDEQGKRERKREDVALPVGEWLWQDEWHVDMGYGKVGAEIDEDGWTYGVEFPGFSLNRIKRTYRDMDGVRRRRWIRTRISVPPPVDDPTRPLAVAWRVALLPDGRTELAVEGTVRLLNGTDVGLEVRAFIDPTAPAHGAAQAHPVDPLPPNGSVCLPLLLAYASTVQVRPLAPPAPEPPAPATVASYEWSPPFLIARGAGASEETVVAQPTTKQGAAAAHAPPPVALVVDAAVSGSGLASVYLRPPFVVENFLPCHLLVSVAPHGPGTAHVKAIPPGATAGIVSRPPQVSQDVRVKILDYAWSQDQELGGAPSKFQNLKSFCLAPGVGPGEELWLTGWVTRPKGPASRRLQMHVYARNWVVDRTGLCLGFAEEPRPVARAARVRTRTVPAAAAATMGVRPLSLRGGHGTAAGVGGANAVEILDVAVQGSARPYRVAAVDNGSPIYTDRPCVFAGLPPRLRRKPALLAPNDDKALAGDRVVTFRVSEGADVYLLYDVSGGAAQGPLPGWIAKEGFLRAEGWPVVAVNTQRHEEGVIKFQVLHKHVPASAPWVTLGGNGSTRNNYVVVVGKEAAPASLLGGAETASTVLVPGAAEWGHWEEEAGGMGLLLYDPRNHKQPRVCVCVGEEVAWSKPVRFVFGLGLYGVS